MEATITIYGIDGGRLATAVVTQEAVIHEELMTADYVKLSWSSPTGETLPAGAYIEHDGERYSLLEPYAPQAESGGEYRYEPEFQSRVMAWGKQVLPLYTYEEDGKTVKTREMDWEFTGSPADAMYMVEQAILNETGEEWQVELSDSLPATITISSQSGSILSALNEIADACETEWWADKGSDTLYLSRCQRGEPVTLTAGGNVGVPSVTEAKDGYYTRFYVFGSTRNVTQESGSAATNSVVNKRLTLDPATYPGGYIDAREGLLPGEIFTAILTYDDIYPSSKLEIGDVRARLKYRLDSSGEKIETGADDEGNPVYEQYAIWYFQLPGLDFDPDTIIPQKTLSVHFENGQLAGRDFELAYHEKASQVKDAADVAAFQVKAGDYEIIIDESEGMILPGIAYIIPQDGDKATLYNIEMPAEYTASAQAELAERALKDIARRVSDNRSYEMDSNPVAFKEDGTVLSVGQAVSYAYLGVILETRVLMVERHLDFPWQATIRVGNELIKGNTQQLKEEVTQASQNIDVLKAFNELSVSLSNSYANAMREMQEGFARIGNMWRVDPDRENTIYSDFNAYVKGWLSAKGANDTQGEGGGGGGLSYSRLDTWEGYTEPDMEGWVLSAKLANDMYQDINDLKSGVAMSYAVTGTGNAVTDVTRDGSRWVFTRGKTFSELGHTHPLANIYDLNSSWDSLLKEAPSAYITRWPSWTEVKDKPSTFTPSAHQHPLSDLSDLHSSWDAILKAAPFAGVSRWPSWGEVTGKPTSFTPSSHTHAIGEVTGLQAALEAKLPAATFEELFEKVTLSTGETAIRAKYGLYSDKWVSAKGANPNQGEGGGFAYTRLDTWEGYDSATMDGWVLSAKLGYSLYNDVKSLKAGAAVSFTIEGTGNAITDISKNGTRLVFSRGTTFALSSHQHLLSNLSDLNDSWRALLKAAPTAYVTRWPSFSEVTGKPTTLSGYGITDAALKDHTHSQYLTGITKSMVEAVLTGNITSHTHSQYLTSHQAIYALTVKAGTASVLTFDPKVAAKTLTLKAGSRVSLSANATDGSVTINGTYTYTHPTATATTIAAATGRVLSAITVNSLGHVTSVSSKTLAAADIPTLAISKISGLQSSLDSKLAKATFDDLFEKVTLSDGTVAIHAKYGFYSDGFVSGKGANPSAGEGGGGAAYNRLDTWDGYSEALAGWVLSAGLGYSLYNDVKSLKQGAAVSLTTQGSGNAVTDIAKSGTKLTVTKGLSFLTAVSLATISDLHSSWDAALKAQKPNWLTAVSLATIGDLHANWDALLKAAPSAYVTRWPSFSEVGNRPSTLGGYGIADGVNAVSVTGSGNAVSAASVSGHTLTLTKGVSALTAHQAIYALTLQGNGTTIGTYNPKSAAKTINLSAETLRMARGNVPPQTGRNQNYGWLYSYNCTGSTTGDRPTTYMSVVGFGLGTGGTVEIGGGWVSSMGLWYRALRDCEDDWYAWRKLLDSVTYTEYTVTKTGGGASGTWGIGISGNAATASKWAAKRTISLTGAVTGSVSLDGSGNVSLATTYAAANISALDSRYVNVSGDTMTGTLTLSSGSTHKGARVGNVYVNAIDRALIIQNAKEIRFGQSDNWAYNDWGGLTYDHSKKYLYLGIADGTIFQQNAGALSGGSLLTPGIGNIFVGNNTSNKVWHAGNDGSGSGLDADTVDGTHKNGLFTAFSANGNSTRITIGGVTKDLTVPYASNADKLDGLQATSFMRCDGANGIALTGGNGNTEGYRLVIQKTMMAWSINNLVFVVASRHNGQGILSVAFHITADSPSSYGYSIRYFGASFALSAPFRAFYNKSTHVFRLYWHYNDYTACGINVLRVEGFPSPSNGTWYETLPSDNGTELSIKYNDADTLGGTAKSGLLTALSSSTGTNLSLTVGGTTKTVADLYATAAEKLLTARTLWGRSFDGSANVSGDLSGVGSISASGVFSTSKATNTYLAGNQGQALVNSTASAGAYVMLHRGCSTNGYFTMGTYQGTYLLQYTAKSTVTAGNNSVTKSLTLLNEAGNSTFPGTVNAALLHATTGVYSDGYVSAKGQNTSSDMRLKRVLGDVSLPLERIAKAPSFRFRWRDGSGESAGSSAQYWRGVLPQAVNERGGYLEMQYGNIALLSAIAIARETMRVDREVTRLREECRRLRRRVKALEGAAGTRHLTAT